MAISTVEKKMLYCQKCQHEYEENGQRFCINDGSRLVPLGASQTKFNQSGGVFSSILSDVISFDRSEDNFVPKPESSQNEVKKQEAIQNIEPDILSLDVPNEINVESPISKPFSRIINPSEIPSGQAELGDRETRPAGRRALTWDNTKILVGQTIKGRYEVTKEFKRNESSITYLAEDRLVPGKKVFVCVLMEENDETDGIFGDERISLSHINHPNINRVIDSGSLLEGKSFITSEYIEGVSLKEVLAQNQEFDILRTARIIRQTANALSIAYQNGVLHRNLTPEDIILSVNETGNEQVKVINFSVSKGNLNSDLSYKTPEQLERKSIGFESDIYSLAIIAYRMLTGRMPFNGSTVNEHLRLRREGMSLRPSNFRLEIPFSADEILKKALSYKPSNRYPKARDFGDALYNALSSVEPENNTKEKAENDASVLDNKIFSFEEDDLLSISDLFKAEPKTKPNKPKAEPAKHNFTENIVPIAPTQEKAEVDEAEFVEENDSETEAAKSPEEPAWQRRSTDPVKSGSRNLTILAILGIALLFVGLWGVWAYFLNRPNQQQTAPAQPVSQSGQINGAENPQPPAPEQQTSLVAEDEIPPQARKIEVPPNSVYFENSKENLNKELLKYYRGFSLYYPNNWKRNNSDNKFIDISIDAANGAPVEQLMISPYESKGTFSKDMELFPQLVEKSNKDLTKALDGKYEVVSEGETTIQNGRWKAYEVKFQSEGNVGGEKLILWGRRLWIPVQRPGAGSGLIITKLATSNSSEIKNVEDVGVKGKLAEILYTFEPDTNF